MISPTACLAGCLLLVSAVPLQGAIEIRRAEVPPAVSAWRASLKEGRPVLRGFHAGMPAEGTPFELPREEPFRATAALVSRRLARDGLLATTAAAIEALGAGTGERNGETGRLAAVGLPVDWLEYFAAEGEEPGASSFVRRLSASIAAGEPPEARQAFLSQATFAFRPSLPGFAAATESGEEPIAFVRVQIPSSEYWRGPGDGGSLDVLRQLLAELPGAEFIASVEEKHAEAVVELLRGWAIPRARPLTIVPEPLPVSQWAQDDGKPGLAPTSGGAAREIATLVPRYASRGEDGAPFVPGETFLADGLAAAGHRVVRSPLLFQGGDLLVAREPGSGERWLLIGEANVWRNRALGLSPEQVLEAFRIEFGVDRCKILPAVSFHIDQEISLRSIGSRLVAFVADPDAAVRIVLRCGIGPLESSGVLSAAEAAASRADLEAGRDRELLARVVPAIASRCRVFGRFPQSVASAFSLGPSDSGVGNFQCFLLATDRLTSRAVPQEELRLDPHSMAYLRSFKRRDSERAALVEDLRASGIDAVLVPSLPEADRGIDYLNGLQDATRYLMPAWGGLYAPLDQAAEQVFRRALGPGVEVVPILTSESQRRGGALHCSVSVAPKPKDSSPR